MIPDRASETRTWAPAVAWGAIAYGIHKTGSLTGLYFEYGWFQNLTHAASASAVAGLVAVFGLLTLGLTGRCLVAFVLALTAAGAVGWEVVEYFGFMDAFGVPLQFHSVHDMTLDMASNAVGVAVVLGVLWVTTGFGTRWPDGGER